MKPVPIESSQSTWNTPGFGSTSTATIDRNSVIRNTYWLLALSMLPTVAGAYLGASMNFASFYRTSPIMAPLLMFAAMFGMLFVVSALRNSGWGIAAVFGFTFVSGVMLAPMLQHAAGLKNGGAIGRPCGWHDRGRVLRHGGHRHGVQARFQLPRQVPVRRRDPVDRRIDRQPVLPGTGAHDHDFGGRGADILDVPVA